MLLAQAVFGQSDTVVSAQQYPTRISLEITNSWECPPQWSDSFIGFVKNLENDSHSGWKQCRWYPYPSFEGGMPTIGYGYKIRSRQELRSLRRNGLSDQEANDLLVSELNESWYIAQEFVCVNYDVELGCLSLQQQEILTEFVFNVGDLNLFPVFTFAVIRYDIACMADNYKRSAKHNGHERVILTRRNHLFFDRYIKENLPTAYVFYLQINDIVHDKMDCSVEVLLKCIERPKRYKVRH